MPLPLISNFSHDKPFILHKGRVITQGEFLAQVLVLKNKLPSCNYLINLCKDRYYFSLLFCACVASGNTSLLPQNRQSGLVSELLLSYEGSVCVSDDVDVTQLPYPAHSIQAILSSVEGMVKIKSVKLSPPDILPDFIAAIAFTSGSTGNPSPNKKRWATLMGTARMLQERLFASQQEIAIVATVPSQHMYGLEMTLMMALQGIHPMSSAHPFFPQDVVDALNDLHPYDPVLVSTPAHLRVIVGSGVEPMSIGKVISATAALSTEAANDIEQQFNTEVEEIYGCTEAGSMATRRTIAGENWMLLTGMVMANTLDGIVVTGPQLNGSRLLQDEIECLGRGEFRFLGRSTDMINVAGKRASLSDLTLKVLSIEGVKDAFFIFDKKANNHRPTAFVVSDLNEREILACLESKIDSVFFPRPLIKVDHIPRNETGKVTLSILKEMMRNT